MLTYYQALEKILSTAQTLPAEEVELEQLLDRILAKPVQARFDLPLFDNSAVDGFGVLLKDVHAASEDKPAALTLTATIHAGDSGDAVLAPGQTVKILTGAPVPPSVEAVIMREYTEEKNGTVYIRTSANASENIRRQGAEFHQGDDVLPAGMQVNPAVIGLLASFGHQSFSVYRQPKLAVVVTGDELKKPGEELEPGQIYESNSFALKAAVHALGIRECVSLHCRDQREATKVAFQAALEQADVIISAGGVSVGEHDYVKVVLEEDLAVETVFWRVAIKPGKPVYFGFKELNGSRKLIFGLPGNPVSALVTFNQFVKPALRAMQGEIALKEYWTAIADSDMRKKPGRMDFVRGILKCSGDAALNVLPTRGQDSHMLSGLAKANCLIHFPADDELVTKGQPVNLDWLDWHN